MMERQAKDGTFYQQVGQDEWAPVTREAKDGTVYKKIGADDWAPLKQDAAQSEERPWYALDPRNLPAGAMAGLQKIDEKVMAPVRKFITEKVTGQEMDHAPSGAEQAKMMGAPTMSYGERFNLPNWVPGRNISPADIYGVGLETIQDPTNLIPAAMGAKKAIAATEIGAKALGATERAAVKAGSLLSEGSKEAGKHAISVLLGPNVEAINQYLKNPEAVKSAKSVEEIKNIIDDTMHGLFEGVESAKISKDEAKEALQAVESKVKDAVRDSSFQFRVDHADLKDQFKAAHQKLDEAFKGEKAKLSEIKSPIDLTNDVGASIQDLKQRIKQGSEESYKILDQDKQAYGVRNGGKLLRQMADEMDIKPYEAAIPGGDKALVGPSQHGAPVPNSSKPVTSQSIGVQNELRKFAALLEQTPEKVPASELKKMLQQIDASEMAAYGQPGFDSRVSQAYKTIRRTIDDAIKAKNPAYEAKMAEVARDMSLMQSGIDRFGNERAAASRLNAIGSRTADADRMLLRQLGEATGRDFHTPVEQYLEAQSKLKDPQALEQIRRGLPEYKDARKQEFRLQQKARPEASKDFIEKNLKDTGLNAERDQALSRLQQSEGNLEQAKANLDPFKTVTPNSSQNMVQSLMKAPGKENIQIRKTLEDLSKMSQKDFVSWIHDRRAADQFKGEFRLGSRNVNLWSIIGGSVMGPAGFGLGAGFGAVVDRYGPKMAQGLLDGALKIQGSPTKAKIMALKLDPKVEFYLIKELSRAGGDLNDARKVSDEPKKGPDKWANDGFEKLIEHSSDLKDKRDIIFADPKLKELLIQASDLKPGTKAMEDIKTKIKSRVSKVQD